MCLGACVRLRKQRGGPPAALLGGAGEGVWLPQRARQEKGKARAGLADLLGGGWVPEGLGSAAPGSEFQLLEHRWGHMALEFQMPK